MTDRVVLLVEDNPDDVLLIRRAFERTRLGARIEHVEDGERAIAYLSGEGEFGDRVQHPLPAMILLDIHMPRKGGFDVLDWRRGRPHLERIPVVVLTTSDLSSDLARAYELGADSYLIKPADPGSLRQMMETLCPALGRSIRILLLDDNPDDMALTMRELQREFPQAEVVEIRGPHEFHQAISAGRFDILVTDHMIGWTNGLHVLRLAKARWPDRPVVILTGTGSEVLAAEAMKVGLDDYVLKSPRHRVRLPAAIRSALGRARQRRALRESEARNSAIFRQAAVGISQIRPDGSWIDVNSRFCEITGYSRDELLRMNIRDITHPEDLAQELENMRKMLEGEALTTSHEKRYVRKDDTHAWVSLTASLVRDASGEPSYLINAVQDISDRKRLEEQLLQSRKLEAIGRLAGGVAHEFNSLLTAILGYAHMLRGGLGETSPFLGDLDEIRMAGERAAVLVRQLLAFSRKQLITPDVLDLNHVLADLEPALSRLLGDRVELSLALDPALHRIKADRAQIEEIVVNLATNARAAMPAGGKLAIETRNATVEESGESFEGKVEPGAYAVLAVRDSGTGMDAETLAHVFEPFFTTKDVGKGTGLGLASVYGIVKQHGGYLRVQSEPGSGSTFTIFLRSLAAVQVESATRKKRAPDEAGAPTILVVEDEPAILRLARRILEPEGCSVLTAANASEALQIIADHPGPIHLLITDIAIPGKDGVELASLATRDRPDLKVLYMSGHSEVRLLRDIIEPDVAFLEKPFMPGELVRMVREVMG